MCKETLWILFHVYSVRVFCKQVNHVKRIDIYPNKPLSALVITTWTKGPVIREVFNPHQPWFRMSTL